MDDTRPSTGVSEHRWLVAWGLGSVAAGAASLLVPLYVVRLGGTAVDLGLLGAVAAFVGTPAAVLWGRLADRTADPRRIILFSLAGTGALLGATPLVSSIPVVVALNALLWLAFAAAGPVVTLLVVAGVPERAWTREIARLNVYQGYGWAAGLLLGIAWTAVAGPLLGPIATQRLLFVVCGATALVAAGLLARWMPAPSDRRGKRVDAERVARLLATGRRGVRGATFLFAPSRLYWSTRTVRPRRIADRFTPTLAAYFLGVVLFFTGFAAFFAPLPLYLTGVGFSGDLVFGLYLVASLGSAAAYGGAGAVSERVDLRLLHGGALGVRAVMIPLVAVVGAAFAAGPLGTVLAGLLFGVIGITWAVIAVTAGTIVTRIAPRTVRGEALGVYAALSVFAGGLGSVAGGTLASAHGFTVAFVAAGGSVLAGAAIVIALRGISDRTRPADAPPPDAGTCGSE